jgi:hypothetical protein
LSRYPTHVKEAFLETYSAISPLSDDDLESEKAAMLDELNLTQYKPIKA